MAERLFNPFAAIDIVIPTAFKDELGRYCQTGGRSVVDQSPFPRMVDLWFLSVCIAARLGLPPAEIANQDTYKIIDGSIFGSDPWRIHALQLIAIAKSNEVHIVAEPRKVMALANGLAVAGLPKVFAMIKEGGGEPIWNLSDSIDTVLNA